MNKTKKRKEYIRIKEHHLIRIITTVYESGRIGAPLKELIDLYKTLFNEEK